MAGLAIMSAAGPAAGDEFVALPFACSVDRGQVALTPGSVWHYRILGRRASHPFTACAPGNANRCRTWQIHKFDLACGAQRVSWLSVVAAAVEQLPGTRGNGDARVAAKVDNGRLLLQVGALEPQRPLVATIGAEPRVAAPPLAFPPGYAPSLGMTMRFTGMATASPTVVEARAPRGEPKPAKAPVAVLIPVSDPVVAPPSQVADTWVTTTNVVTEAAASPLNIRRALWGFAALLAAWGLLSVARTWTRSRTPEPVAVPDPMAAFTSAASAMASAVHHVDDAALCAELIARAVNLHRAAREAVGSLQSENLRTLLGDDLARVQRLLLAPDLTTAVAERRWGVVKTKVAAAMADLERIARIIAGVLASAQAPQGLPAGPLPARAVPETPADAFEVLGLNPEASRTVVKKVVDGLRQSWHPDHARDEPDRRRREDRMKQINSAWDLIRDQYPATEKTAA
jgi:hypothetical protein